MSNPALSVLQRLFVVRFYRINAGFLLVVFLLLFGVADGAGTIRLHYALMRAMAAQPRMLLIGLAAWTAYYLKAIAYCLGTINEPRNSFLYELQGLPGGQLKRYLAVCLAGTFAPVLLYAGCTAVVAVMNNSPAAAIVIAGYQVLAVGAGAALCHYRIMRPANDTVLSRMLARLQALRPAHLSYYQYLVAYAAAYKKRLLILLKAGSLLLLQLMVAINRDEPEPEGTFYLLLFIITAHGLLPYYFVRFIEANAWLRNLPMRAVKRYALFAGTYAVLLLPEIIFLLIHLHTALSPPGMISYYLLAVAMLCWLHTSQYVNQLRLERYVLMLACLFVATIFILTTISVWWLAGFWLATSIIAFPYLHRRYEAAPE